MRIKSFFFTLVFILFIQSCTKNEHINKSKDTKKDSVSIWIKKSRNESFSKEEKLWFLDLAHKKINSRLNDQASPRQLSSVAYRYYELNDTLKFLNTNATALEIAIKKKDSFVIGDAHWSYADFYITNEIYDKSYYHYNTAYKYFNHLGNKLLSSRMLFSMSFIKGRYRDYSGSEVLIFEAIKGFKELKSYRRLYESYNHLAILQNDISEYDNSILYLKKAMEYLSKMEDKQNFYSWNLNNLGHAYLLKKEYKKALKYFNKALKSNKANDKNNYAIIIDNIAYCNLLMKDTVGVKNKFLEALSIRDGINNKAGIVYNKIRLSEYFAYTKDTLLSIQYANQANMLAKVINNGGDYLNSLKQLASVDKKNSTKYLNEHIKYNDSLVDLERKALNKFTRIEFETDEVLEDNKILNQKLVWIFSGSLALILILSLLYFIRVQRAKNEKLFLETEQQKANEQVYLLTLRKQAELEEEKVRERNRISQELHDGILGRLFGTRVGMGFLDINADEETQKQHESFLDELQEIEKEIREVSHKLNDNFEDLDVNFTTIINQLLESKSKIGDFKFHLNIDQNISWKSTDEIIKVNVYRIIQETLQNTIKHAKAENVTLDFSTNEQELNVHIKDDGVGFNLKKSKKGIGLKNIKSRIEKLNGTVEISSAPNKGTQIHIKIPIV